MLVHAVPGIDDEHSRQVSARSQGAPAAWCRRTMISGLMDSRLRAVSTRVSLFPTLLVETLKFRMSALRRLAAISNEERVRVDAS